METNFDKLSPEIREEILTLQKIINAEITDNSSETVTGRFAIKGEESAKEAQFKLADLEDGSRSYVFDRLLQ